jgi:hypothetical protein
MSVRLDAFQLLRELGQGEPAEGIVVVGLDRDGHPCGVAVNPNHRALSFMRVWELAALAEELDARALVVGLFPAGRSRPPSPHEIAAFESLRARAQRAQVVLLDCLVVRGAQSWSLCELSGERLGV